MQTGNIPNHVPHPSRSLGYQIIRWAEDKIRQPDGANAGGRWSFTPEQKRFLLWFYAINDEGKWLYRTGSLRRSKGWLLGEVPIPRCPLHYRVCWTLPVLTLQQARVPGCGTGFSSVDSDRSDGCPSDG